jgi:hypothetical protein
MPVLMDPTLRLRKCIDALERLVHHALDASAPVSVTLLPGTDAKVCAHSFS